MKKHNLFKVLALFVVLIASINTSWAYSPVYLNGDFTGGNWGPEGNGDEHYQVNYELDGSNSGHYFLPIYTSSGDKYWRFCENNGSKYLNCPASDNYVMNVGTAAYQIEGGHKYNFKSTVDAGIIAVHIHQNYDGKSTSANGSNDRPRVWLERPTIYIWHNWNNNTANWNNNGGSGQKAMTDNNDGTYTYDGQFAGTSDAQNKTNVGIQGSAAIKKYFEPGTPTLVGSPTTGDMCRFTWNSNGYLGYDGETVNRGTLTITKLWKITYDGNGNGGGSAPDDEYVMHNTATATYTNTGSMTKTNMAFIGWNTQADGKGTHYDAGANITLTSNKTLYAEWVPCWILRGGDTNTPDSSPDAMGDWGVQNEFSIIGTNAFMLELDLAASTTYYFKIVDRHNGKKEDTSTYTHYGCNGTMTTTTLDWAFYTNHGNCQLSTGASGAGKWRFVWNASNKYLCVYAPADAPKSSFAQGKYIYFDARNNSTWKANPFNAKFWFKNLASGADDGNITCENTEKLDDWVYYALVPADKTWGSVQMNNLETGTGNFRYNANIIYARDRTSADQNCMVVPSEGSTGITLTWDTYCPPMSDVDLEEDGTTLDWGGNGSSGTPYLIPTGASIKVKATNATKAVNDDNMTIYYQFKKAGTEVQAGSTTASATITASGSTGTKEAVTVEAYNYYNSTSGTHLASNEIYYEVRTPYTISYNAGTDGSGLRASETKLKGVNFATPNSAIFTRTGYTQTGWATSNGGSQLCALGGNYTSDADATLYPVWTANNYTVTLDNREADIEDGTESVSVTFDATTGLTSAITKPEKAHYDFGGYYTSNDEGVTLGTQLIDANGNWKKSISGYTGADGNNPTWVYAGNLTLYAKWTEHEYTITIAVTGSGSVNVGSSTTAKYVTASGDITATPSPGYSFREWGFSETGTGNYDVYVSDGSSYSSTDATIKINAQHNGTLTANFTANTYTVRFENLGADAGHKGSLDTTVTFNDTIHMKGRIEVPSKAHYEFGGYYISTDKGATLTNIQIIDANGNWNKEVSGYTGTKDNVASWVCAGDTVLYAKWTETAYTITPSVSPAGAGSVNTVTDAHLITPSSTITATPANAAWIFDYWEYGTHVGKAGGDGNAITVTSDMNSTITAHFKPRYELVGDIWDGSGNGGMPGWSYDGTGVFTFNSFTALGTGDGKGCDLSCSRTLTANTTYRFQIHDRVTGNHGYVTAGTYLGDGDTLLLNTKDQNVMLRATGAGTYTFRITNITESTGYYYPTVTIERPHQVYFGQKYLDIDGALHEGTTGGSASVKVGETAKTSGDYVNYNTSVTHDIDEATGYHFAGWWGSDEYEGDRFSNVHPMTYAVTSDDHAFAKFTEDSTHVHFANDGHGHVEIGGVTRTDTIVGITTHRKIVGVPDVGYKFSSWDKTSGSDYDIDDLSSDTATLSGNGGGATSGQTVTANFTYRWALKAESVGWGAESFTIENISTDGSGDVVGYVEIDLAANTDYQFTIKDLQTNDIYKNNNAAVQYMTYSTHENWGFATTYTFNCGITTAGKGTYRFTWNITDKTMTVTYPASYQVNYGASPSVGGSITVVDDDSQAVPNGGYVRSGGDVTYTVTANPGYTFVGWFTDDTYGTWFSDTNPWPNENVKAASNAYAKFKSTNFVIYRTGDMEYDPRAAYDDVESFDGGIISEVIEFRMQVSQLDTWYSLCIPFEVNAVKVWDEDDGPAYYDIVPYYRSSGTFYTGHYIIRTPESTTNFPIANFGNWNDPSSPTGYKPAKNTPYIIQWHDPYFLNRYVSFFGATGQDIPTSMSATSAPTSDNVVNVCVNDAMTIGSVKGAYMLEPDYGAGGAWLRDENPDADRSVLPFECYIRATDHITRKYRVIRRGMTITDTPTGFPSLTDDPTPVTEKVLINGRIYIIRGGRVYSADGQLVK